MINNFSADMKTFSVASTLWIMCTRICRWRHLTCPLLPSPAYLVYRKVIFTVLCVCQSVCSGEGSPCDHTSIRSNLFTWGPSQPRQQSQPAPSNLLTNRWAFLLSIKHVVINTQLYKISCAFLSQQKGCSFFSGRFYSSLQKSICIE